METDSPALLKAQKLNIFGLFYFYLVSPKKFCALSLNKLFFRCTYNQISNYKIDGVTMKRPYLLILFILVFTFIFSSFSISQVYSTNYSTNFSTKKIEDYYKGLPVLKFKGTKKIMQLIGDLDFQTGTDTKNLTQNHYTLTGTDLGYSFEHDGFIIFLFGDAINNTYTLGGDCIGYSTTKDPECPNGLRLDFFTKKKLPTGKSLNTDNKLSKISTPEPYLKVLPDNIIMAGFEIPCGGISVKGKPFIFCIMDNRNAKGEKTGGSKTYLIRFYPKRNGTDKERFVRKGIISALDQKNSGRFIDIAAHLTTGNLQGLPSNKNKYCYGVQVFRAKATPTLHQ